MQLPTNDTARAWNISPSTIRRRLAKGLLTGDKVRNRWYIDIPDEIARGTWAALARSKSGGPFEGVLDGTIEGELRSQLFDANDRIRFLESEIRQLASRTFVTPAEPKPQP